MNARVPRTPRAAARNSRPSREVSGVVEKGALDPAGVSANRRVRPKKGDTSGAVRLPPPPARPTLRARFAGLEARVRGFWARIARPVGIAARVVAAIAIAAGAVALYRLAERHAHTSPAFAITEITIEGQTRLDALEISDQAGIVLGANSFDIAPADAQRFLLQHPWIASAEVERRLPGTFRISIREREAAAVVAAGGGWLVSNEGELFAPASSSDSPIDLPIITGLDPESVRGDRQAAARVLVDAVTLLSEWRSAGLWRSEPIGEIHVEHDESLSVYIGADAVYVRLGRGPFRGKLTRLRRVLDELARRDARPAYVYLDNVRRPDRVTVRGR